MENNMNRRNFIKTATACLFIPPTQLLAAPKLVFTKLPDTDWFISQYLVKKGNLETRVFWAQMQDLADCHGICATDALSWLTITQLEYQSKDWEKIFAMENLEERKKAFLNQKKNVITEEEKQEIYDFINNLRGPHDCVKRAS